MDNSGEGAARGDKGSVMVNGIHLNGDSKIARNTNHRRSSTSETMSPNPPEISPFTTGFVPMSLLISRLAQETFNELENVINDMADMPAQQSIPNGMMNHVGHQVNGIASTGSEANVQKKMRLLNFTNMWRPKFIKVLVLSNWARRAHEVSRAIDLKLWLDTQEEEYNKATFEMGQLHRIIACIKEPSPDIKTALQVLLQGKVSGMPDLDYLTRDPLTPQQILETLRRINTLLSIRLNLHENIPPMFRDFSIGSGRVTFRVPDEFEVDLSIADESPTSQFFFVDFRFAFSPGNSTLSSGRLEADLQGRANDILRLEGLQGLFDLLHNLVLTHKLSVLRSQAYEMVKGYWSEHVVVEPVRRSVVLQYWSNRPGGKNWIEIGVKRGEEKRFAYLGVTQKIPQIAIRSFRAGKEVKGLNIDLHPGNLSMEKILKQAIASHTSAILSSISLKLGQALLYSSGALKLRYKKSSSEPTAASLMVQITGSKVVKIMQEPVTGCFAVLPSSPLNKRLEIEINRLSSPSTDSSKQISLLRALSAQEEVEEVASTMGWEPARSVSPGKEALRRHFPKNIQQTRFYRKPSWNRGWLLAFTSSLEGDAWWVVELSKKSSVSETAVTAGPSLKAVYRIPAGHTASLAIDASPMTLAQIERNAVGMICQYNDSRHLSNEHISHKVSSTNGGSPTFSIYFRYQSNKTPSLAHPTSRRSLPWANEIIRLDYRGLNTNRSAALRVATARLTKPAIATDLKELISAIRSLAVNPISGSFAFQLRNQVGEACIPELTRQLSATERLLAYASVVKRSSLPFTSASLSHLEFLYAKYPGPLKATLHFPEDKSVRLSFSAPNPHLRILDFLNARLVNHGLKSLISVFRLTLPLLTSLSSIETRHKTSDFEILARSEQWYEIRYSTPLPKSGFDIRLRRRRDTPMWYIAESSIRKGEHLANEEEWTALLKTVTRGKGERWRGVRGGIIAEIKGISDVVDDLDAVFRSAKTASSDPEAAPAPAPVPGPASTTTTSKDKKENPGKRKAETQVVEIID